MERYWRFFASLRMTFSSILCRPGYKPVTTAQKAYTALENKIWIPAKDLRE